MKILILITTILFFMNANAQELSYKNVNPLDFQKLTKSNKGTLLDVRTKNEFKNQHIQNAGQINYYNRDFKRKLLLLSKDEDIYLYCNTGYRSRIAAEFLIKNGYTKVYNLEHGIMDWNLKNLPTITEPDAEPDKNNKLSIKKYQKLIQSDTLVFLDFYAPWCAPCRKMMPTIDSLKVEYSGRIKIKKVNADASKKLMKDLKLNGVPYLVLFQKGKLITQRYGYLERKEIVKIFEENLAKNE